MTACLTFHFTPLKEDFIKTTRAYQLMQKETRSLLVILSLLFLFGIFSLFFGGINLFLGPLMTLILLPAYLLSLFVINPLIIGRQVRADESLRSEVTWIVDDEGVQLISKHADVRMEWGSFARLNETREHFLLTRSANKRMFQIVPKRAFTAPEQACAFRSTVTASLAKAHPEERKFSWFAENRSRILLYGVLAIAIVIMVIISISKSSAR